MLRFFSTCVLLAAGLILISCRSAVAAAPLADSMTGSSLGMLFSMCDDHFHKGEYCHSVRLSKIVIQGNPWNMDAYANSAWLLWSMNRDPEAVELLEEGSKANPATYYMYDELGVYYAVRKKDYVRSIDWYKKATACKDCPALTYHGMAHSYEKNGQLAKAVETWNIAVNMKNNMNAEIARINLERVKKLLETAPIEKPKE